MRKTVVDNFANKETVCAGAIYHAGRKNCDYAFIARLNITDFPLSIYISVIDFVSRDLLTLSLPECLMEFCKVTLTIESVDEIL